LSFGCLRDLPAFPTRRSSDLGIQLGDQTGVGGNRFHIFVDTVAGSRQQIRRAAVDGADGEILVGGVHVAVTQIVLEADTVTESRSEEHTSELQSRENLVCRLL